jgi:hypothetical protein
VVEVVVGAVVVVVAVVLGFLILAGRTAAVERVADLD